VISPPSLQSRRRFLLMNFGTTDAFTDDWARVLRENGTRPPSLDSYLARVPQPGVLTISPLVLNHGATSCGTPLQQLWSPRQSSPFPESAAADFWESSTPTYTRQQSLSRPTTSPCSHSPVRPHKRRYQSPSVPWTCEMTSPVPLFSIQSKQNLGALVGTPQPSDRGSSEATTRHTTRQGVLHFAGSQNRQSEPLHSAHSAE
jgi:hypothetical protein